jgi:hypothetical protein
MLAEDEAEAVLGYVDQRGDDVLLKAGLNARAKIQAVLRSTDGSRVSVRLSSPGPPVPWAFPGNAVPLRKRGQENRGAPGCLSGPRNSSTKLLSTAVHLKPCRLLTFSFAVAVVVSEPDTPVNVMVYVSGLVSRGRKILDSA